MQAQSTSWLTTAHRAPLLQVEREAERSKQRGATLRTSRREPSVQFSPRSGRPGKEGEPDSERPYDLVRAEAEATRALGKKSSPGLTKKLSRLVRSPSLLR